MDKYLPQSQREMHEMFERSMSMIHIYSQRGMQELQVHWLAWLAAIKSYSMVLTAAASDMMNEVISTYHQSSMSVIVLSLVADTCTKMYTAIQSIATYVSTFIADNDCHDFGLAGLTFADVDIAIWLTSVQHAFTTLSIFLNDLPIHQYLPQQLHSFVTTITSFYYYITNYIINHVIKPIDTTMLTSHSNRIVEHSAQFVLTAYDLALRQFHYNLTTAVTNITTQMSP